MLEIQVDPEDCTRTTYIGAGLADHLREKLIGFLRKNKSSFTWSHADMVGINPQTITHRLNVDPGAKPIRQKRRKIGTEKNKVINEEISKLLENGLIREVQYPNWLANTVVVPKKNGKMRVCIDFTDLNKSCPKDSFLLPHID